MNKEVVLDRLKTKSKDSIIDSINSLVESPEFIGTPTAPTADLGTSTTQLATTEFVSNAFDNYNPNQSVPEKDEGDLNSLTSAGTYCSPSGGGNVESAPSTGHSYTFIVLNSLDLYIHQIAIRNLTEPGKTFMRHSKDGGASWSNWSQVLTSEYPGA